MFEGDYKKEKRKKRLAQKKRKRPEDGTKSQFNGKNSKRHKHSK